MALLDLKVLHVLTLPTSPFHVLLDIMASVMLMLIHNSLLLVSHSAQALVWTQSPRVLMPSPKVLLFHTPDMPLHTLPGDLESVRPKPTPLSTPLPQLTLTPPHTPLPLPTPSLPHTEDLSTLPLSEAAPTLPEPRSHARRFS